ncbi:helix-turn-helix domain-containing protein [Lederbergia wuyishanensis]|uniref:Uncharacterized protein n=1 Tax=Lederbergia wuyishanensis TaxID=1347903 RepID=A0ABU0D4D7_9BACI|nr:helix-turn-helix domain-containing protein [Lederbergia wuyishanensis]MCJ8008136.1 helix-turn-helix domain-containing protein [Lederbergia wuyishanensis]MDQ0343278.1 hypothetical protein [Lederbergia wuyishanensis]
MELTAAHWMYLAGTVIIILTMLFRQNVVVPSILVTFLVGWIYTGSFIAGLQTIFNASLIAAGELFNIFLIIAIMTALLYSLKELGSDEQMITPFQRVMKNGHISFWVIIFVTYAISLFFWPTPAVPLVGALLIPVAIRAGLPPIGAAIAISLAGQGMALSSDYVIQIAPTLTATAALVDVAPVADRAFILSLITGITAIVIAYLSLRKNILQPSNQHLQAWENSIQNLNESEKLSETKQPLKSKYSLLFAILIPITFLLIIIYMVLTKFSDVLPSIEGGTGAALIGGASFILLIAASIFNNIKASLNTVSDNIVKGFVFAFKAMGPVIPIAGFFFIGSGELAAKIFSMNVEETPSFLFDLVLAGQQFIPENSFIAGFGILIIGMITGLDGSGFSGLPLVGSLSGALGSSVGVDVATLGAIGQMGAVWVGGGTPSPIKNTQTYRNYNLKVNKKKIKNKRAQRVHVVLVALMHRPPTHDRQTLAVPLCLFYSHRAYLATVCYHRPLLFCFRIGDVEMENKYHFGHLENYATFNSVQELNLHVNGFRDKTTATEFKVLWFISKYSVKFIGAAHLKLETIAEGISMSIKTVQRAIKSLIDMGAIQKVNTTRPIKGGQGANIYQIQPSYDLDVQAQMSKREDDEKHDDSNGQQRKSEKQTAYSLSNKSINSINTYTAQEIDGDTHYSKPYSSFIKSVGYFIDDRKTASKMYGIYLAQTRYIKNSFDKNTLLDTAISAIRTTFLTTKKKEIKSITGYFNGILDKKLDYLYVQAMEQMWDEDDNDKMHSNNPSNPILYNWLDE